MEPSLRFEIHPAIGVARLGSSPRSTEDGYFLGPEPGGSPPDHYRDPGGYLKRQAARFRLFVCRRDTDFRLLSASELELSAIRRVTWTVHLANRKGVARRRYGTGPGYRNGVIRNQETDRELIIDPGPRSVCEAGDRQVFDSGRFRSTIVPLGEMVMEPRGRLRVLGGYGRSGSDPSQIPLTMLNGHFADNKDWFDDTSDGPVTAAIELQAGSVVESHAWVIVAPPDFAPAITNLVTLYDVLFDRAVARGIRTAPTDSPGPLSFTHHIRPILERAVGYRWVNRLASFGPSAHGRGHAFGASLNTQRFWSAMADSSPTARARRTEVFGRLRKPHPKDLPSSVKPLELMPRISGPMWLRNDAGNVLALTPTQYRIMERWADGDFVDDRAQPCAFAELLPDALDRIALEACVGAPLYPGIEVDGLIMHDASRFMDREPFRLSHSAVLPGEVTCQNAVPWQADFLSCRWQDYDGLRPRRLGWWPAQRPDDVYRAVGAPAMLPWDRGLGEEYQDMVEKWDRLGFVVDKGPPGSPFFIESEREENTLGS